MQMKVAKNLLKATRKKIRYNIKHNYSHKLHCSRYTTKNEPPKKHLHIRKQKFLTSSISLAPILILIASRQPRHGAQWSLIEARLKNHPPKRQSGLIDKNPVWPIVLCLGQAQLPPVPREKGPAHRDQRRAKRKTEETSIRLVQNQSTRWGNREPPIPQKAHADRLGGGAEKRRITN